MKKIIIILLCICPAFMHAASIGPSESLPAAPGGPKEDAHKQAHAWVDKVLKEVSDKLDRLVLLNYLCEEGYVAYLNSEDYDISHAQKFDLSIHSFPAAQRDKMNNILSELPKRRAYKDWEEYYHAIQIYYHELYRRAEIPEKFMCVLTKELLPKNTKDRG
jgi:hypothetical protein